MNTITGKVFATFFPDDPIMFLTNFLISREAEITIAVPLQDEENNIFITRINQETAKRLIRELLEMLPDEDNSSNTFIQ